MLGWLVDNWYWVVLFLVTWVFVLFHTIRSQYGMRIEIEKVLVAIRGSHGLSPESLASVGVPATRESVVLASGTARGAPYEVRYAAQGDMSPPLLVVSRFESTPVEFSLARTVHGRNAGTSYGFSFGFNYARERKALQSQSARAAFATLIELDCPFVRKDAFSLDAVWLPYDEGPTIEPQMLDRALNALADLADVCRALPQRQNYHERSAGISLVIMSVLPFALAAVLTLSYWFRYAPLNAVFGRALLTSIPLMVAIGAVAGLWFRWVHRRAKTRRLVNVVMVVITFFVALFGGLFGTVFANGMLDSGQESVHVVPMIDLGRQESIGREPPHCTVWVHLWSTYDKREPVTVRCEDYEELAEMRVEDRPLPPVEVRTKPGFLGLEWPVSIDILWDSSG
ncbi:MAG: hypothetical protein H6817_09845 [Phycisphaerales bacterium]|nr:hypothetical protein [Phycisphaerales bacterium]